MSQVESTDTLPLLPIRDMVVMPHIDYPLLISRSSSLKLTEAVLASEEKTLVVVTQKNTEAATPAAEDLYTVGTRALIHKMARLPNNSISLSLRGLERVELKHVDFSKDYLLVNYSPLPLPEDSNDEVEALHREVLEQAQQLDSLMTTEWPHGLLQQILQSMEAPLDRIFILCSVVKMDFRQQQEILESSTQLHALELMHDYLTHEIQILTLQQDIAKEAAASVSREQRHYMLRQQLQQIQKELGEQNPEQAEVQLLQDKLEQAQMPEAAKKAATQELERLQRLPASSQDYQLARSYLDLLLELPWQKSSEHALDLVAARRILDEDHFDLEEIKDRIIEHLAVYKLNPKTRGAILCFVGGPGVGKTSLGASIAKALGREFERISLGGLHDEAELRGHRRTYIGAMPGRIIQAVRRKGVNNPLLLLDEVDKVGQDYRGDPAAALMEILDPAQNVTFRDNYLDLDFDLSNIFFVATANTLDTIPRPLLDRMEIIRLSGYTEEEKVQIARQYLLPAQLREVNLSSAQISVPDAVIAQIIRSYTREAGVRELDRQLARLVRKSALPFAAGKAEPVVIRAEELVDLLGRERFFLEKKREDLPPGVSVGLAWTEAGGDVLFIESVLIRDNTGLTLTGQLGDVMKESAQAALSYIRSQAQQLGLAQDKFRNAGVHIHVPAGAVPKDGPSAGVTIAVSLLSLFSGRPVRNDTAMTGEISLSGLVLPVGGIKEKVLAARRAGLLRIILPADNARDLDELDPAIRQEIEFILVSRLPEAFAAAIPASEDAGLASTRTG